MLGSKLYRYFFLGVLAYCLGSLGVAVVAERFFDVFPCKLCMDQRYVLWGLAGLSALAACLYKKTWVHIMALFGVLGSLALSVFQLGVEQGWWKYACPTMPIPSYIKADPAKVVDYLQHTKSCRQAWKLLGIPVSLLNLLAMASFIVLYISLRRWMSRHDHR